MPNEKKIKEIRNQGIRRHDIDSRIFQGQYDALEKGKYTNAFIYGRYMLFEEIEKDLQVLPKGAKILDLGCGTGHFAQYIKEKGFEVIGLDPSEKMLDFAKNNFPNIEFVNGLATKLPFEDNTFDLILSIEVLRYLPAEDIEKTYQEVYRVLKVKGKFVATHVNKYALDGYYFFYHAVQIFNRLQNKTYHNCYFTTANKELNLLKQTGFKKFVAIGRMYALIRIGFKGGSKIGTAWTKLLERKNLQQLFKKEISRSFAAHLITRGVK